MDVNSELSTKSGSDFENIVDLKEKLKLMRYLASFSTNNKRTEVRELRKSIARKLTACNND